MASSLSVLVLESDAGAADAAVAELEAAGISVDRCHPAGADTFPCRAMSAHGSGPCPVEQGAVDVVLTVRAHPRSHPSAGEDGVRCAIRHHLPLVVAGETAMHPFEPWATAVIDRADQVAEAVRGAAAAPLLHHGAVAASAADDVIRRHGYEQVFTEVDVRRRHDALRVLISPSQPVDRKTQAMVGVRVVGAIREIDQATRQIDVCFA